MKTFIFMILILSLSNIFAQTDSVLTDQKNHVNSIQLYMVNDISAAYKHMFSDKSALDISVEINGGFLFDDTERKNTRADGFTNRRDESREDEAQRYHLVSLYKYYPYRDRELKLFLGMGPLMGYEYRENIYQDEDNRTYTYKSRSISAGISLNTGIEYHLTSRFFLIAEYRFLASYEWYIYKNIYKSDSRTLDERTTNRIRYDLKNIRLGIGFNL